MNNNEKIDLGDLLSQIEPWTYKVFGIPVKEISIKRNSVTITWFSEEELEKYRVKP